MPEPKTETKQKLQLAAVMKADGYTWKEIDEQFGVGVDVMRTLRKDHPDLWAKLYREASLEKVLEEAEPTALNMQMEMLKKGKEFIREMFEEAESPDDLDQSLILSFNRVAHSVHQAAARRRKQVHKLEVEHQPGGEVDRELVQLARQNMDEKAEEAVEEMVQEAEEGGEGLPKLPEGPTN